MSSNLQSAREWANLAEYRPDKSEKAEAAMKVILSLPDQWVDAEKVRKLVEKADEGVYSAGNFLQKMKALIAPKPPTLEELIEAGNDPKQYQWMRAKDSNGEDLYLTRIMEGTSDVVYRDGMIVIDLNSEFTPLPDLPKLEWPGSGGAPTIAQKEKVTADQQPNASESPKSSIKPEDVPVNEVWKAEIGGKEYTAARIDPDSHELPWIYANKSWTGWSADSKVTLLEKLTPTGHALPEGMRLADHAEYGRVIVSPHPDEDGDYRIFGLSAFTSSGILVASCKENELTFLDGAA